jgi:hypothetical protein
MPNIQPGSQVGADLFRPPAADQANTPFVCFRRLGGRQELVVLHRAPRRVYARVAPDSESAHRVPVTHRQSWVQQPSDQEQVWTHDLLQCESRANDEGDQARTLWLGPKQLRPESRRSVKPVLHPARAAAEGFARQKFSNAPPLRRLLTRAEPQRSNATERSN